MCKGESTAKAMRRGKSVDGYSLSGGVSSSHVVPVLEQVLLARFVHHECSGAGVYSEGPAAVQRTLAGAGLS